MARFFCNDFFSHFLAGSYLKMANISKVISVLEQAADMLKSDGQGESSQSLITAASMSNQPRAATEVSQSQSRTRQSLPGCSDIQ